MKGSFLKWLWIPAATISVIIIGVIVLNLVISSNPVIKTGYGLMQYEKQKEQKATMTFTTDISSDVDELFDTIQWTLRSSYNRKTGQAAVQYDMSFEEDSILDIVSVYDDGYAYFDIPQVLDEDDYYYYELDDYMDEELMEAMTEYIDMVDLRGIDYKSYAEAILEGADGHIWKEGNKVIYELDAETLADIMNEFVDVLADDEDLAEIIQKNAVEILEAMEDDDFEYEDFDDDVIDEGLDLFDDDDFIDDWMDQVDELEDNMDDLEDELEMMFDDSEVEVTFNFGFLNKIKSIEMAIETDMGDVDMMIDLTKGYSSKRTYDEYEGHNIDHIKEADILDIVEELLEHIEDYMDDNEDFEEFVEDYSEDVFNVKDVDDLFDELIDELKDDLVWYL